MDRKRPWRSTRIAPVYDRGFVRFPDRLFALPVHATQPLRPLHTARAQSDEHAEGRG